MNKITVLISSILLTFHTFSYAQVTTSGISGRVSDETENLIGAFIKAVHTPSGTSYSAVTNTEGRYTIQGMRTGGPYRIEINYLGYTEYRKEHILLPLGETLVLNARLNKASRELGEVTVSGTQPKFTTEKTGITTHISPQEIALLPSINRGIADLTRLSPYASGMNFGGRDGRSNTFTIDGAHLNNNFGLNSDLPGGGNPISLEALEEVQINIAPFDVRQANFIGASINAITKSGTNTLKASAYSYIYNQNMRGNRIGDVDLGARDAESKNSYGFTLGGPVIKDKLFFFVNAEYENSPGQITQWRASKDGQADAAHLISRTTEADMDKFSRILYERYNYKTGSYSNFPGGLTDLKIAGRLDWNINAQNRFSFRYNQVKNENWMGTNPNTAEPAPLSGNRISQDALSFFNSCYATVNTVKTATVELNSRATNNMFNQLLLTYTHINQGRDTHSEPFPFIDILQADEQGNIKPYMSAGYELFTWNTETTNQVVNAVDNYTFYSGNHKLTAGLSFEYQTASTSYMSNGLGYYRFSSFDDFKNGAAPEAFALCYGYDDVKQAGVVSFVQSAAYLQDEWNLRDNLSLTAGLRFDHTNFVNDIL
ncbi:MAG: TonB-dependent receptor, partial [Candidatus Symbiothrix sp.]|nr:TonB-dependent receptor [Candidatus Symbiothrix sp.]